MSDEKKQFLIDEDALADVRDALTYAEEYLIRLPGSVSPGFATREVKFARHRLQDGEKVKADESGEGGGIHEIDTDDMVSHNKYLTKENVRMSEQLWDIRRVLATDKGEVI